MLDSVLNLGALRVIEAVYGAYEITGDAADALEGNVVIGIAHINLLAVDVEGDGSDQLVGILGLDLRYVRIDFCL